MFKAKKKWLIAPLFFIGVGLGTAYQTNLVKADAQAPNSSEFTEAPSSGASSGQNGTNSLKSASASVATASSSASDGQAKASTANVATTTNSKIGGSQSSANAASASQTSASVESSGQIKSTSSASAGSNGEKATSALSSSAVNASDGRASQGVGGTSSGSSDTTSQANEGNSAASVTSASANSASATNTSEGQTPVNEAVSNDASSADVSTASEFDAAMADSTVSVINVQSDFVMDVSGDRQSYAYRPNLVINGNNHTIDFQKKYFEADPTSSQNESFTINDLNMYGYSWWGPVTIKGSKPKDGIDHSVVFNNVTYTGAQLMYGIYTKAFIKGNTKIQSVGSYVSPLDGSTQTTQGLGNQQNFQISYLEVLPGATYTGTTTGGTNVEVYDGGSFIVDKGATVNLQRTDASKSNERGTNALIDTQGGNVEFKDGSTVILNKNALVKDGFAPIYIEDGGNLTVDKNATVSITGATGNIPVRIDGTGTVNLNEGSHMTITQNGAPKLGYGFINIKGTGGFFVASGSTLDLNVTGTGTKSVNAINVANDGQLSFAQDATANLTIDGGTGEAHLLKVGDDANINIYMPKSVLFKITDNDDADSSLFKVSGTGTLTGQYVKIIPDDGNAYGPYKSAIYTLKGNGSSSDTATVEGETAEDEQSGKALADTFATDKSLEFVSASDNFIKVNPVTDETTTLTGKTTAGAYVTISGSKGIPEGSLTANSYDSTKYLVQADKDGNWSYELPTGVSLPANASFEVISSAGFIVKTATVVINDAETPKQASSAAGSLINANSAADVTASQAKATSAAASDAASYASEAQSIAGSHADNMEVKSLASDAEKQSQIALAASKSAAASSSAAASAAIVASSAASEASSAAAAVSNADASANSAAAAYDSYASEASAASAANDSSGYATASSAASSAAAAMSAALSTAQVAAKVAVSDAAAAGSAASVASAAQSDSKNNQATAATARSQALDDLNKIKSLTDYASGASSSASEAGRASTATSAYASAASSSASEAGSYAHQAGSSASDAVGQSGSAAQHAS
ncbi:pectate lyase-like adhesive domain-containing protein, partial [Lacticaseibacillus rhamnosus]|uniref:pectate lyase-like adhesive domain-containing protein n=1 Tax=Lacticaseibacillus rhamnosus TaxID=47715 RepID=UPI003DA4E745